MQEYAPHYSSLPDAIDMPAEKQASSLPFPPNSSFSSSSDGFILPNLEERMQKKLQALSRQIPAAEQEAQRLSRGIKGRTPSAIKQEMGARLQADFSGVRLHTDQAAAGKADAMGAMAYTAGRDIYFGSHGFDPQTAAHELVHTVQQGAVAGEGVGVSAPMGEAQMLPRIDIQGHSQKSYLFDGSYRELRRLTESYNEATDPKQQAALKKELMEKARAYQAANVDRHGQVKHKQRGADVADILAQLEAPKKSTALNLLDESSGIQGWKAINNTIASYNANMAALQDQGSDKEARQAALSKAQDSIMGLFQVAGEMDSSQESVAAFKESLMEQVFDYEDDDSDHGLEFRRRWGDELTDLARSSQTGYQILGQIFEKRHAVNPDEQKRVFLNNPENKGGNALKLLNKPGAMVRDNSASLSGNMSKAPNQQLSSNRGAHAKVDMPSLPFMNLYKNTGLAGLGKMLAAHELVHALHYINGIGLSTQGAASKNAQTGYQLSDKETSAVSFEELSTTGLRDSTGSDIWDYLLPQIQDPATLAKLQKMRGLNEAAVRDDLHLPKAIGYSTKHTAEQIGRPEDRMNQAQFDALTGNNDFTKWTLKKVGDETAKASDWEGYADFIAKFPQAAEAMQEYLNRQRALKKG